MPCRILLITDAIFGPPVSSPTTVFCEDVVLLQSSVQIQSKIYYKWIIKTFAKDVSLNYSKYNDNCYLTEQ